MINFVKGFWACIYLGIVELSISVPSDAWKVLRCVYDSGLLGDVC